MALEGWRRGEEGGEGGREKVSNWKSNVKYRKYSTIITTAAAAAAKTVLFFSWRCSLTNCS